MSRRATIAAVAVTTGGTVPLFLAGAMGVHLQGDLQFSSTGLGVAVAAFTTAVAAGAWLLGGVADRLGGGPTMRIGVSLAGGAAIAIGVTASSLGGLALLLAVAGIGNALAQPAANSLLMSEVATARRGVAFGIFQSAKPIGVLLSGLAVPLVALTVGWRWAFIGAGVYAIAVTTVVPRRRPAPAGGPRPESVATPTALPARAICLIAVGFALSFAASDMVATFFVDSAVQMGIPAGSAGLLLSACAGLAIVTRVVGGHLADRSPIAPIRAMSSMLIVGALGSLLIAVGGRPSTFVVGATVTAVTIWGMNGLFFLSLGRLHSVAPGSIAGIGLSAGSFGGIVGPISFGVISERASVSISWVLCACCAIAAGVLMRISINAIPPSPAAPLRRVR